MNPGYWSLRAMRIYIYARQLIESGVDMWEALRDAAARVEREDVHVRRRAA